MEMAVPLSDEGREALDGATHKVSESFVQHRYSAVPMECRAVTASWEPFDQRLDVWHASQNPHEARSGVLARDGRAREQRPRADR